jgi:hypothetical protein
MPGASMRVVHKVQAQFKSTTSKIHPGRSGVTSIPKEPKARPLQVAAVVRLLCVAADIARAVARAAGVLNANGDRSTVATSFVASTDGGSGSTADSVSEF